MRGWAMTGLVLAGLMLAGAPRAAWATGETTAAMPGWLVLVVLALVWLVILGGFIAVKRAVAQANWSVADALSEATEVTLTAPRGALNPGDKVTEMRASSSRTIAFMGSIVILGLFLGFGSVVLYGYASTGELPKDLTTIIQFLLAGLGLFAPYAVNKLSSAVK